MPITPPPESEAFDYAVMVARVAAVAFPFAASGIALFDLITSPLRGKRLTDWCEQLRLNLNELSDKVVGLTPEKLASSEEFNSAFVQAAQIAVRTHRKEKLDALRNAVLNVALGREPDGNRQEQFLAQLTVSRPCI